MVQFTQGTDTAPAQLEGGTQQLARAATRDPLVDLVGAPDVRKAWRALQLERQRSVLRSLVTVTLTTPRPGRMPDGGYFDYEAVVFEWKRGASSPVLVLKWGFCIRVLRLEPLKERLSV
ncbi:hypothetical protein ACWGQ5_54550 [Streptomyces sp. NPDC055722]